MGGAYIEDVENGGGLVGVARKWGLGGVPILRPKAARLAQPPPFGCFWHLPLEPGVKKNSSEFEIWLAPKCQPPKNMVMMVGWRAIIVLTQLVLARLAS